MDYLRLSVFLVSLLLSCDSPTDIDLWRPPDATLMEPLPEYRGWWREVESCVGAFSDFWRIQWYAVPGYHFSTPEWGFASGRWVPPHDIYLAEGRIAQEMLVKHEMVHELLRPGRWDDPRFEECSGFGH